MLYLKAESLTGRSLKKKDKQNKLNIGDPIAALGPIDLVSGSVDLVNKGLQD